MSKHDVYALPVWSTQTMGPKPTREMLVNAHALCGLARAWGKQALARALELRADGATDGQIKAACIAIWGNSGSHHNKRTDLVNARLVKLTKSKPGAHTVYRIELTAKGVTLTTAKPEADTAKPAKAAKPRKPKAVKPEPAPVTTEVPAPQADQPAAQ